MILFTLDNVHCVETFVFVYISYKKAAKASKEDIRSIVIYFMVNRNRVANNPNILRFQMAEKVKFIRKCFSPHMRFSK